MDGESLASSGALGPAALSPGSSIGFDEPGVISIGAVVAVPVRVDEPARAPLAVHAEVSSSAVEITPINARRMRIILADEPVDPWHCGAPARTRFDPSECWS